MTLTEYINQTEPVRMPNVVLNESEYIRHTSINTGVEKLTFIEIPLLYEKYGVSGCYVQLNDAPELYTTQGDGNKKTLSCFRLEQQTQ